jgi:putative two-component system response regulator
MLPEALRYSSVVVIDDATPNLRLLESSLRAFGLRQIQAFSDSAAGLAWLKEHSWDLLLLDLDMPAPNGFDILKELENRDRGTSAVIIVTALSDPQSRRKGLELGANDYISKPLDLPELLLRVRNSLQLCQATQALQRERDMLEVRVSKRTSQLRASYETMIRSLSKAAEYKDYETGSHIMRVGESAMLIARAMGLDSNWIELLSLAAPMHDVGKIGVPDGILLKPGRLTDEELLLMKQHAVIGYEILTDGAGTELTDLAAEIALSHHERWDGNGYPNGLAGEAIPLAARIVCICDVYDALRSTRPYKLGWEMAEAQDYIREQAGRHFDPHLVEVMSGLFDEIEAIRLRLS